MLAQRLHRVPVPAVLAALAAWTLLCLPVLSMQSGLSWHFFLTGQHALQDFDSSTGGLHLYAAHPVLQIGPVALLAAGLLAPLGTAGSLLAAQLIGVAAGAWILWIARDLGRMLRPDRDGAETDRRVLLAAFFFVPVWEYLAVTSTHLDDVLALLFGTLALRAAVRQQALLAGLFAALAVDAKPWALPFGVALLMVSDLGQRVKGVAVLAGVVAAAWLPFFLGDPATLNAVHYTIVNTRLSSLRVLGVHDPRTPTWDRPAQTVLGLALGAVAIWRARAGALILLVVAARVVLDPGTNRYYTAGLVVGALIWDSTGSRRRLPWWTGSVFVLLFLSRFVHLPGSVHGWATLLFFLACVALCVVPPKVRGQAPPGRDAPTHALTP